jgi:hypothetical protein
MGAVCCGTNDTEEPKSITITSLDERQRKASKVSFSKPGTLDLESNESKRQLFQLISKEEIENDLRQAQEALAKPNIDVLANILIDENLKVIRNNLKVWAFLNDLPNGYKLHNYYSRFSLPFTPEFIAVFSFNLNQGQIKKMDDNIDYFELLDYSVNEDTILVVTKTITKKILVVPPKSFLVLRALKRLDNGNFIEFQKSVELTSLANDAHFKHLIDDLKNAGEVQFGAESMEFDGSQTLRRTLTKVDVKSGVGMLLIKSMLKNRIKTYNENLIKQMSEFLIKTEDFSNLIWFDADKAEKLKRIFEINLALLKNSSLDFTLLDQSLVFSLNEKTSKPKEEELDESDIGDRIDETREDQIQPTEAVDQEANQEVVTEQNFEEDSVNILGEPTQKEELPSNANGHSVPKDIQMETVISQSDESSLTKAVDGKPEVEPEHLKSHLHEDAKPIHLTSANHKKSNRKKRKN